MCELFQYIPCKASNLRIKHRFILKMNSKFVHYSELFALTLINKKYLLYN